MKQTNEKADAARMIWFECLANYPLTFKRQQMVDGEMADFYSEQAKVAIFIDGCKEKNRRADAMPKKLYLSSKQIKENPIQTLTKIQLCICAAQLY